MGLFYEVFTIVFLYILVFCITGLFVRHRGRQGSPVPEVVLPGGERPVPRCRTSPRSERVLDGVRERVSGFLLDGKNSDNGDLKTGCTDLG